MKIAVSGKGGVGKTTISALLAMAFLKDGYHVLCIDADSNPNLALVLGVPLSQMEKIVPISENEPLIEEKTGVSAQAYGGVFRLSFRVDDIVQRFAMTTPSGVALIVMGAVRSAGQGCMCPANALIRALLRHLLMKPDEVVIVDMEAGVEHLGRGTVEHVDAMLIVTEPSVRSFETARRIQKLARESGIRRIYIVGNRLLNNDYEMMTSFSDGIGIPILALLPYAEVLRHMDAQDDKSNEALEASESLALVKKMCEKLRLEVS